MPKIHAIRSMFYHGVLDIIPYLLMPFKAIRQKRIAYPFEPIHVVFDKAVKLFESFLVEMVDHGAFKLFDGYYRIRHVAKDRLVFFTHNTTIHFPTSF